MQAEVIMWLALLNKIKQKMLLHFTILYYIEVNKKAKEKRR